ncbi:hypothetical protein RRG08_042026 [Elysia crispata]|uniref:Uncharacterized protein n=1 Tax=Elysia crispata TaxID=231223 RepID=A0AAE1DBS9_9GAST|nr:hypothetical protein RRG08_042026 [Elysia crispata]
MSMKNIRSSQTPDTLSLPYNRMTPASASCRSKGQVELCHSAPVILSTQQNTLQVGRNFGHRKTRTYSCWLLATKGLCG